MANPRPNFTFDPDQPTGLLVTDCGATSTLTNSFANMSDVVPEVVSIHLAGEGISLLSSHRSYKTYYILDSTATPRAVTTKAFYVKDLKQDLLGGRALVNTGHRVILDQDDSISGVYPVTKGKIDPFNRFEFASGKGLFYVKTVPLSASKYSTMSGYCLWHHRMAHVPNATLKLTIEHSDGLEDLVSATFSHDDKCPACMAGKGRQQAYPNEKERATVPLERVYIDSFSSSVVSIEGYSYALVIVDCATDMRWIYGMRTKDDTLPRIKKWYSDIADLRAKFPLIQVCRDNAGENKSQVICDFIESVGAQNYFSTSYEQWQNGVAESTIGSIMLCSRAIMAESGLGGRFWFRSAITGKDARNATYNERIKTTPYKAAYGVPRNVSKFRAFGAECYMYLNDHRREKGKHSARGRQMIYVGLASDSNTSGWQLYDPANGKMIISNQVRFDERSFPYRKPEMLDRHAQDSLVDIFTYESKGATWEAYDKSRGFSAYTSTKYDPNSDELILRVTGKENTFARTTQYQYFQDLLNEQAAMVAEISNESSDATGVPPGVNLNKPPRSYKDAMSRVDRQEWDTAYFDEYQGFVLRNAFEVVRPPRGAKVLGTTTVCNYKRDTQGHFLKRKVRMCVRGDKQVEGVDYTALDLYSPVLKASEVRLLAAIAAEHDCKMYKTDTRQAFLYGSMEDDEVYIRPPDWWCAPVPEGHVFKLKKQSTAPTSGATMAQVPLGVDGGERLLAGEQREDHLHQASQARFHHSRTLRRRRQEHPNVQEAHGRVSQGLCTGLRYHRWYAHGELHRAPSRAARRRHSTPP